MTKARTARSGPSSCTTGRGCLTARGGQGAEDHSGLVQDAREVRRALPDDLLLAVGTVRTEQHVREAVDAGADFLVSQVLRPALVDLARDHGVPFVPGALTPEGILDAWETGVPAVEVSPIGPLLGDALLPGGDLDALAARARRATAAG